MLTINTESTMFFLPVGFPCAKHGVPSLKKRRAPEALPPLLRAPASPAWDASYAAPGAVGPRVACFLFFLGGEPHFFLFPFDFVLKEVLF